DEVESNQPVEVVWNLHTPAKIEVASDGTAATLSQAGKTMAVKILSPAEAKFEIAAADPEPTVKANPPQGRHPSLNTKKLIVKPPEKVTELRLIVLLTPKDEVAARVNIEPLQEWMDAAPHPDP